MDLVKAALSGYKWYFLAAAVAAYFCGCFNGALFASKTFFHDDVRSHGSGNAGLTNFYRTYGAKYAVLVIACDMLKAVAAVFFAAWLARLSAQSLPVKGEELGGALVIEFKYWAGLFCALGHMFPCTAGFKGGKGILCSATLTLLLDWRVALACWGTFALLWLTTRYVSLGSVGAAAVFPIMTGIVFHNTGVTVLSALIAALVIWAHRENIRRLCSGTENKFHFHVDAPKEET